ncbi:MULTISPECIES: trigger factor [Spongiibacter]|uniref:trigger factor n=1 Tax=Spongiibacter TaxID=630749 RepID=UPI000C47031B|nr:MULTISPECIES: trigger factor [Spongiibacter]MAY37477.1 trigger factor [Spongiibacter sp.]MBI59463.1 trigger factor [Spongiibacter sp.]|tara:strand:- start:170 stop:1498 length:1329 start_codon:yes stop_codon:yes gene_type:complete
MQVSVETTSGLERRLIVGVPSSRVDSAVDSRLQEAAKTVKLNGFRPGKVPMRVIRQRFGQSVRMEVLGQVMNDSFYEAIQQQGLKPAGRPEIEPKSLDEGKDIEFVATFEVFPEIELKDYSSIEVKKPVAEITTADIDEMIENLRTQRASWEVAERAAAEGDQVNIDFVGTKDGEEFEGGKAEGTDLELGSGRMIPGFEDGIVGMTAGEEKVVALTFPEDYHSEELKGAAVEFKIKVNAVKERKLPELDDEFFKAFGVEEGGEEAFRAEVEKNMARELKNATKNRIKTQVMDGVLAVHGDLQVPKALISQEIDALRNQQMQQFGALAEKLNPADILPDDLFRDNAERRVKLGLVLNELISSEEIKADADKVRETLEEMAASYEDKEEVINWYMSQPQQLQQIEGIVIEEQVVEKLLEKSKVSEETLSYKEVMSPPSSEDEEA